MRLTVYGVGCAKCAKLEEVAREAIKQLDLAADIEHVKDVAQIARAGILMTPALAINGKVVVKGKVPQVAEVVSLITTALEAK